MKLKNVQDTTNKFKDRAYKEIQGYYIVLKGHIDIVSHRIKGKKLQEICLFEGFGESSFLNAPSFEYIGDIYGGFGKSLKNTFLDVFKKQENVITCLYIPGSQMRLIPQPELKKMRNLEIDPCRMDFHTNI